MIRPLAAAALILHAAAAGAAECRQERAAYSEPETGAVLQFSPAKDSAVASHGFTLAFKENGVTLKGLALYDAEVRRPHAMLMLNCPEGDVTGDELAACTVWEGVVYAIGKDGHVGLLPPEGADAADQLLLPGLASWLRQSSAYGEEGLTAMPWDAFALAGCAPA